MWEDKIFELNPIHSSVIYQILSIHWNHWIQWKFGSIEENSIGSFDLAQNIHPELKIENSLEGTLKF